MTSEAQKKANAKYRKEKMKQVVVAFSPKDAGLYDWLCSAGRKASHRGQSL